MYRYVSVSSAMLSPPLSGPLPGTPGIWSSGAQRSVLLYHVPPLPPPTLFKLITLVIWNEMGAVEGLGGLAGPTAMPTALVSARLSPWRPANWSSAQAMVLGS